MITGINFNHGLELDRAHRIPTFTTATRKGNRPMICKPLRYQHTEAILNVARKNHHITWERQRITFTQDYSKETVDIRKGFLHLRDRLRERNIPFSFSGPAKFRITENGRPLFFTDPNVLARHLEGHPSQEMDISGGPI